VPLQLCRGLCLIVVLVVVDSNGDGKMVMGISDEEAGWENNCRRRGSNLGIPTFKAHLINMGQAGFTMM
jgi:hypothetical protein